MPTDLTDREDSGWDRFADPWRDQARKFYAMVLGNTERDIA